MNETSAINYQKKRKWIRRKDHVENFLISSLPVIGFILFGALPMLLSLVMCFFDMRDTDFSRATFIGFQNFQNLLDYNVYGKDILYTLLTTGMFTFTVPIGLAIAVFIAYQLNLSLIHIY